MKILLVEPNYKNKYQPLGLMKISTYHKLKGDIVTFTKGKNIDLKNQQWDRIYISTLFTFYWSKVIDTIDYYYNSVATTEKIYLGGVLATLMGDEINSMSKYANINIIKGLINQPGMLGNDQYIVDELAPDYLIIDTNLNPYLNYRYNEAESYIAYSTRGCIRKCKFCAVPIIEPEFKNYYSISKQIDSINVQLSNKELRDIKLMDNNILASANLEKIVEELIDLGYGKNNKSYLSDKSGKFLPRFVDFNQGIDARLLTNEKLTLLSKLNVKPLRIAFDSAQEKEIEIYVDAVKRSAKAGFSVLSNYVLYNYEDTPEDLYVRLSINAELNTEFKSLGIRTSIFSFPMRYSPIIGTDAKVRTFRGEHWNKKFIRTINIILNASHGVVSPNPNFFYHAFGEDIQEFKYLLWMPEHFIFNREFYSSNGYRDNWQEEYDALNEVERLELIKAISLKKSELNRYIPNFERVGKILKYYLI